MTAVTPLPYGICCIMIRPYIYPGWNRRRNNGRLEPIYGRRLIVHRILWGYQRLVFVP